MNVGVLGTGTVGQAIASKLVSLGHAVAVGSRSADNAAATKMGAWSGVSVRTGRCRYTETMLTKYPGFGFTLTVGYSRPMRIILPVFFGVLVASACAREAPDPANPRITVRTYASTAPGSVNTHWIETPSGVIVIDGQRVSSEARHAVREIRRSAKPVLAILVTHPHPDHFGGLGTFVEAFGRDVPIFASQRTIDTIRNDEGGFIRLTEQHYGDDFEEQVTLPNRVVADGQELVLGGVTIKATDMGEGEAPAMTIYSIPSASVLFPGDIVGHATTPFLLEGRSKAWLAQLERLNREFADITTIHPGHGSTGGPELIDDQARYLSVLRELVAQRLADDRTVTRDERAVVMRELEVRYPKYPGVSAIEDLGGLNVDAVARELGSAMPTGPPRQ